MHHKFDLSELNNSHQSGIEVPVNIKVNMKWEPTATF
jgi:hypothetical protein